MQHQPIDTATAVAARFALSCDLATLSGAVDYLARRVVERRETIPILACIMIRADIAGTVTLNATDAGLWASVTIPASVDSPGTLAIDADALRATLAKAGKGRRDPQIRLRDNDGRAEITTGRNRVKLATRPADDWPQLALSCETDPIAFALPAGQFLADLAAVGSCASKEETRYYLNGAALQVRELAGQDRLCLVATDGHAIAAASRALPAGLSGPIGATGLEDVIIPSKTLAIIGHAAKLAGGAEYLQVTAYPGSPARMAFDFGAVRIVAKMIDGIFPDWTIPFASNLAASDASPALFPELLPGAPLASIERIAKAAKGVAIDWQPASQGMLGTVAGDDGLLFGALNMADGGACQRKGFDYDWRGGAEARAYLESLAEQRGLPSPADMAARADAIAQVYGDDINACLELVDGQIVQLREWGRVDWRGAALQTVGGRVLGLTVGGAVHVRAWTEHVTDWEALSQRELHHAERTDPIEGSYSILMPADGPGQLVPESAIEGPDGVTYPVAMNDTAIHLSKEQVRALVGESCFEVMAVGAHFILRWCYENGDGRFLTVKPNGRCFGNRWEYLTRREVDAMLTGEPIPEWGADYAEAMPEPVAVEVEEAATPEPIAIACQPCEDEGSADSVALDSQVSSNALEGASEAVAPVMEESHDNGPDLAALVADLAARVADLEGLSAKVADIPIVEKPRRTAAHERAVRRAWAERKARRVAARTLVLTEADRHATDLRLQRHIAHAGVIEGKRRRAVMRSLDLQRRLYAEYRNVDRYIAENRELGTDARLARECYHDARDRVATERAKRRRSTILARQRGAQMVALAGVIKRQAAELVLVKRYGAGDSQENFDGEARLIAKRDAVRLVAERDAARNACAALEQRCARMQSAVDGCAGTIEALASRVAIAEAALRKAA